MKINIISDLHLGHEKMVEFCGRPKDFNARILSGLKGLIETGEKCLLVVVGDVCIGNDALWHDCIHSIYPFRKILVRGNHDSKSDSWYYDHGWDFVCREFRNRFFGKNIVFSHKPMPREDGVDFNVHGHFHNTDHRRHEPELRAFYDESYHILYAPENENYRAVSLEALIGRKKRVK